MREIKFRYPIDFIKIVVKNCVLCVAVFLILLIPLAIVEGNYVYIYFLALGAVVNLFFGLIQ